MKPIRLTAHAQGYVARRGFTATEVEDAIRTGKWRPAGHGRQETSKEFAYGRDWNGTAYATKRVRPVFVDHPTEIVVITVYTYFF
jgi:Domain of unknown function (DUF4258)